MYAAEPQSETPAGLFILKVKLTQEIHQPAT